MAKETMQAVSEAEKNAREVILHAKEESERLLIEAEKQAKKLIADAKKDAAKKVEILCGVANADAAKQQAAHAEKITAEQAAMRKSAESATGTAAAEIRKIVLGENERR